MTPSQFVLSMEIDIFTFVELCFISFSSCVCTKECKAVFLEYLVFFYMLSIFLSLTPHVFSPLLLFPLNILDLRDGELVQHFSALAVLERT